ncbi:toll/interleukin-1 receptor domain-containing protein [uncultured Winogradskyella sp.]|uniref:toll/interleukin-1 receptor domain-containing protein n=1 Tax=uncultured Winogradskyella sp. TaxID=395353 RepID=UPI002629FEC5|nr:toll/interleukin-1 receptor domain-containing protein [uncultured Winogradskyella sp.]
MEKTKLKIFFAYSRKDNDLRSRLETHLYLLKRQEYIESWYDGEILPGQNWNEKIKHALGTANIILLLISVDFIASDYCYDIEMKAAFERHKQDEAIVIPIILTDCDWLETPIAELQALPKNGIPINDEYWKDKEKALRLVAKEIRKIVEISLESEDKKKKLTSNFLSKN